MNPLVEWINPFIRQGLKNPLKILPNPIYYYYYYLFIYLFILAVLEFELRCQEGALLFFYVCSTGLELKAKCSTLEPCPSPFVLVYFSDSVSHFCLSQPPTPSSHVARITDVHHHLFPLDPLFNNS
jgi:hypothetical protein